MKEFTKGIVFVTAFVLLFYGCSTDEHVNNKQIMDDPEMGSISFTGILKELTGNNKLHLKEIDASIPECRENNIPTYVRIALRNSDAETNEDDIVWVGENDADDDFFIDIPVVPISNDNDDDGAPNYLTMESSELKLKEGNYSLEYFAVLNNEDQIIMMAPRENEDYGPAEFQNFVDRPLPIAINIQAGTKHYTQLQTLCYDAVFARAYGYLFFDFEQVNLTNLCVFGNICDAFQKHSPAHYRLKIWEYNNQTGQKERQLVNGTNEVDFSSNDPNNHSAQVLCVPLPDRQGTDYYYGEIYLIKDGNEELIRKGIFTDTDIKPLYDELEDVWDAYHFRENCCGLQDEPFLLEYINDPEECDETQDPSGCETAYMLGGTELNDLNLNGNKWGWVEYFEDEDGTYTYLLYAAAGQNDLEKGFLAGEVTLEVIGEHVEVNIQLNEGCSLTETHVYLSDDEPGTTAPGQYGNTHNDLNGANSDIFNLSYSGDGNFWIIVHAVVCCPNE